ncbi:hypothetical protein HU200_013852 [Digitaria exilis]|uniref:Uncharacterized protein n=1 Tax=Digitaria exilis TaxID=1010633 RepID=A0A835FDI0_9POAL|nr:hypothetical protein HU200_064199 [Digitaria exilis]KAF8739457.1 hypothetical protein HU200_013852 [Digitaria exilis]
MMTTKVIIQLLIFASIAKVREVDMICISHIIDDKDEETIDPRKVVFVAKLCNKAVPKGEKCGSKYLILSCNGLFILVM